MVAAADLVAVVAGGLVFFAVGAAGAAGFVGAADAGLEAADAGLLVGLMVVGPNLPELMIWSTSPRVGRTFWFIQVVGVPS